eukprot:1477220-Rhodomonas_salina.1
MLYAVLGQRTELAAMVLPGSKPPFHLLQLLSPQAPGTLSYPVSGTAIAYHPTPCPVLPSAIVLRPGLLY